MGALSKLLELCDLWSGQKIDRRDWNLEFNLTSHPLLWCGDPIKSSQHQHYYFSFYNFPNFEQSQWIFVLALRYNIIVSKEPPISSEFNEIRMTWLSVLFFHFFILRISYLSVERKIKKNTLPTVRSHDNNSNEKSRFIDLNKCSTFFLNKSLYVEVAKSIPNNNKFSISLFVYIFHEQNISSAEMV